MKRTIIASMLFMIGCGFATGMSAGSDSPGNCERVAIADDSVDTEVRIQLAACTVNEDRACKKEVDGCYDVCKRAETKEKRKTCEEGCIRNYGACKALCR